MTDENNLKCPRCGGDMLDGIPGDVYCPKDACFKADTQDAIRAVKAMREREERKLYETLKDKYG
jgi:uncharacterized Zn finger protein (UPF0148 family)